MQRLTSLAPVLLACCLASPVPLAADDWPTYRRDARRSGVSKEMLSMPLGELWTFASRYPPSPAWGDPQPKAIEDQLELPRSRFDDAFHVAAAGGRVFFGSSADGAVRALDGATGETLWKFSTDGPVRLAPTVWRSRVYVGSDDGKVYCLEAATGKPVWTFDAAPSREVLLGNGRLISTWPVRTGVLIDTDAHADSGDEGVGPDGGAPEDASAIAYFGAGVFPAEGLYLYAVKASSGELLWKNDTYGRGGQGTVSPQGYMVASADKLFVSSSRAMPAAFARSDGRLLFHRNFNWREIGMFGGTQSLLVGDIVLNAIEQVVAVQETNGNLAFTEGLGPSAPSEGSRCVIVHEGVLYLLTGKEAIRARWGPWTIERRIRDLSRQVAKLIPNVKGNPQLEGNVKSLQELIAATRKELGGLSTSVEWSVPSDCNASIALAPNAVFAGGDGRVVALDPDSGEEIWSATVDGKARGLAIAGGRLIVSTDRGRVHAFGVATVATAATTATTAATAATASGDARSTDGAKAREVASGAVEDRLDGEEAVPAEDRLGAFYGSTAESIVAESGVRRGYALLLGAGARPGKLALELVRRTELTVHVLEPDAARCEETRAALDAAGFHGARAVVLQRSPVEPWLPRYFANLIVSEEGFFGTPDVRWASCVRRCLKPCGGTAFVGRPAGAESVPLAAMTGVPGDASGEVPGDAPGDAPRDAPGDAPGEAPGDASGHAPGDASGDAPGDGTDPKASLDAWMTALREGLAPEEEASFAVTTDGAWAKIVRGPLPGAGSWTHQYAEPGNTATGDDVAVRGPIGILWYGEPGPTRMPSRHAANVAPLAAGGRLFTQGEHVIWAHDAYNGLPLWEREISGALRLRMLTGVSNLCADDDSLFVAIGDACQRLDMATGRTLCTYRVPESPDGTRLGWLHVATEGGLLHGTAGTSRLFAFDVESGDLRWSLDAGNLQATTICLGEGRLHYVDRRVTDAQTEAALKDVSHELRIDRLGKPIQPDVRLVITLDAATGEKLWERPQYVSDCVGVGPSAGGELAAMCSGGVLLLCGQPWNGHFWKEFFAGEFSRRSLIALDARDGRLLWSGRKGYRSRPIIVGDKVVAEPWAYDLRTGADATRIHPVTGVESRWQVARPGHHCGCIAASPNALFFRSGTTAFYDLIGDYGTAHFGAQRPGCWINCIPANGVVMMPEASSGCICPYSIHTTLVFAPREESRVWGMFSAEGPSVPVKRLGISFGAPGDRRDSKGDLWLAYPRPYGGVTETDRRLVMDLPLAVELARGGGYFAENADCPARRGTAGGKAREATGDAREASDDSWIDASGVRGLARLEVPVGEPGAEARRYSVRIRFRDPPSADLRMELQGKPVILDDALATKSAAPGGAVMLDFRGVQATEKIELRLEGDAAPPAIEAPAIAAIEIVAEG